MAALSSVRRDAAPSRKGVAGAAGRCAIIGTVSPVREQMGAARLVTLPEAFLSRQGAQEGDSLDEQDAAARLPWRF